MQAGPSRKTRWRASRSTPRDDEPQRRASAGVEWAAPSRRARMLAAALAVAFAALTLAVVSRVWRQAAPSPSVRPNSVEVKIIAAPAPAQPARKAGS